MAANPEVTPEAFEEWQNEEKRRDVQRGVALRVALDFDRRLAAARAAEEKRRPLVRAAFTTGHVVGCVCSTCLAAREPEEPEEPEEPRRWPGPERSRRNLKKVRADDCEYCGAAKPAGVECVCLDERVGWDDIEEWEEVGPKAPEDIIQSHAAFRAIERLRALNDAEEEEKRSINRRKR